MAVWRDGITITVPKDFVWPDPEPSCDVYEPGAPPIRGEKPALSTNLKFRIRSAAKALRQAVDALRTRVVSDYIGERTLVVPPDEAPFNGDPMMTVLDIESLTGTRLRDGGNPVWSHPKNSVACLIAPKTR